MKILKKLKDRWQDSGQNHLGLGVYSNQDDKIKQLLNQLHRVGEVGLRVILVTSSLIWGGLVTVYAACRKYTIQATICGGIIVLLAIASWVIPVLNNSDIHCNWWIVGTVVPVLIVLIGWQVWLKLRTEKTKMEPSPPRPKRDWSAWKPLGKWLGWTLKWSVPVIVICAGLWYWDTYKTVKPTRPEVLYYHWWVPESLWEIYPHGYTFTDGTGRSRIGPYVKIALVRDDQDFLVFTCGKSEFGEDITTFVWDKKRHSKGFYSQVNGKEKGYFNITKVGKYYRGILVQTSDVLKKTREYPTYEFTIGPR